jgi:hypothetical protein
MAVLYVSDCKDVFTSGSKDLFCRHVENLLLHKNICKPIAAVACLKGWPDRQSLIGESSATSFSSGPSKFATFATDLCKSICLQTYHFS